MPSLNKSGNIFNVGAGAGFDEGILGGNARVGVGLNYNFYVDACHGIDAAIGAELLAEIEAGLKLLWLFKGTAHGNASAAIGAKLNVKADLNIFNLMGITAEVYAAAEAKAAGKLSLNLTFEDISAIARNAIKEDYLYDIFIAFLNELSIGAGVMGNVNAGAAANAYFFMRGSVMDDEKSGFEIGFDYNVAVKVGGGYGFYAKLGIDSPKRFFLYASERTAQELTDRIRQQVSVEYYPLVEILQFAMPVVLNSCYELAQQKIEMGAGFKAADATKAVTNNFISQLQRYLLDKLTEAAINAISEELRELADNFIATNILPGDKDKIKTALSLLLDKVKNEGITWDNINEVVDLIIGLLTTLDTLTDNQRTAVTVVWLAFNTAAAIRGSSANEWGFANASAGIFQLGESAKAVSIRLNTAPSIVKEEISKQLRIPISDINGDLNTGMAIDFLLKTDLAKKIISKVPHTQTLFRLIDVYLGLTPGELFQTLFETDWQENITQSELYEKVRDLLKNMIDEYIHNILITELRKDADDNEALLIYIDEVVGPSSKVLTDFVFDRLHRFIEQNGAVTWESFLDDSFFNALTKVVSKIFTTNVLTLTNIIFDYTLHSTHIALRTLADTFKKDPDHIMSVSSLQLFQPLLKPAGLEGIKNNEVLIATRELAANLCYAAADISGPLVFSEERKNNLKGLYKKMFAALDPQTEGIVVNDWDAFFKHVTACTYFPNPITAVELIMLQGEIMKSSLEIMVPQVVNALQLFYLRLTLATVQEIEKRIEEIFAAVAAFINSLKKGIDLFYKQLEKIEKAYEEALAATAGRLETVRATLKDDTGTRQSIINDIQFFGLSHIDSSNTALVNGYNTLFLPGSPVVVALTLAIDVMADILLGSIQALEKAGNGPDLLQKVADDAISKIQADLHLPTEIQLEDIRAAFIKFFDNHEAELKQLIEQKENEIEASRLKNDKLTEEQIRKDVLAKAEKKSALPLLKEISIDITSPVSFVNKKTDKILEWTYGKEVPVQIEITGAGTTYICMEPQAIFVAINGQPYAYEFGRWTPNKTGTRLFFNAVFNTAIHPLTDGINVIECTVIKPDKTTVRASVEFIMNPKLASDCTVVFDMEKSMLDTGGDDHEYRHNESVAFTNIGNMPADMSGWWLSDLKNHVYEFPEIILMPHETVSVFTGYGINDSNRLYQNKRRAVWNNTEDMVLLINKDRVLVLNQMYRL